MGYRPRSTVLVDTNRVQNRARQIVATDLTDYSINISYQKETSFHNQGEFFWTRQTETETPEDFWRTLIEIEKDCSFEGITAEKSSSKNSFYGYETPRQIDERKVTPTKENISK